jgi:hypothetical protein
MLTYFFQFLHVMFWCTAAAFLRETEPGSGPLGAWYVRDDPTISPSLPWLEKPNIGEGLLVGDVGFVSTNFIVNFIYALHTPAVHV